MQKEHIMSYHSFSIEEVLEKVNTRKEGLSSEDARNRLIQYGKNDFKLEEKFNYLQILFTSLRNPFSIILIFAIILSLFSKSYIDAFVILAVLIINTSIDIYHQKNTRKNIQLLKKDIEHYSTVLRNKTVLRISSLEIVPGDIVFLEEGNIIPADGRIIESENLLINESMFTGESSPVTKFSRRISGTLPISDLQNMVWYGTTVMEGEGKFVVTATGLKTQFGALEQELQSIKRGSNPFLERIKKLSKTIGITGIFIVGIIFGIHFGILGRDFQEIAIFSLAVFVSIIPESLPTVVNITLAKGARYLAKEHAVVKELSTVESLGSTSVIITDKTGTLTENTMRVEHIVTRKNKEFQITGFGWKKTGIFLHKGQRFNPENDKDIEKIIEFSFISNRSHVYEENGQDKIIGESTEAALLVMAAKSGKNKADILKNFMIIQKPRFLHKHKILTTIVQNNKKNIFIAVGAPETIWKNSEINKETIEKTESFANQGLRTIAFAYKEIEKIPESNTIPSSLIYVGFVAMRDPVRENVKETIEKAQRSGIRVIMATGDHLKTAQRIAEEVGIIKDQKSTIIEGLKFLALDEKTQKEKLKTINVFARVTPEVKLLITQIFQKNKEVVMMIGDGINDTLALKQADIGVAMGISGTDTARSASSIVLTNDNFSTVVQAIFQGRHIYKNIKQVTTFLLSTNATEALVLIVATFIGAPLPLIATQILLINLVTDGVASLPFAFKEPKTSLLPKQKPKIFLDKNDYGFIASATIGMTVATIIGFGLYVKDNLTYAQSMAFLTLSLTQLTRLISLGGEKISYITIKSNPWFIKSIVISFGILFLVFIVPDLRIIFNLELLSLKDISLAFALSFLPLITVKIYKILTKQIP